MSNGESVPTGGRTVEQRARPFKWGVLALVVATAGIIYWRFGDQLTLEANVIRGKRGIWKFACRATVDGELACEAEIICAERKVA